MTTSALGLLRQTLAETSADQLGTPLPIREDEWLTETPIELARSPTARRCTHLSQAPDLIYQVSSGGGSRRSCSRRNLLRLGQWLPDAMLFAASRGFPWLLLISTLPPLLRRLGATRSDVLAGGRRSASWHRPALWWSFMPIRILGFTAAGCYLLVLARDRLRRRRLPRSCSRPRRRAVPGPAGEFYVPWSVTVGLPLVLATGWFIVCEGVERGASLTTIGIGAAVASWCWRHASGRMGGPAGRAQHRLSRPAAGDRRAPAAVPAVRRPGTTRGSRRAPAPLLNNQSEISSAFLVCGVWAAALWSTVRRRRHRPSGRRSPRLAVLGASSRRLDGPVLGRRRRARAGASTPCSRSGRRRPSATRPRSCLPDRVGLSRTVVREVHRRRPSASTDAVRWSSRVAAALTGYGVSSLSTLPTLGLLQVWATVAGHGPGLVRHPLAAAGLAGGRGHRGPRGRVRRQPRGVRPRVTSGLPTGPQEAAYAAVAEDRRHPVGRRLDGDPPSSRRTACRPSPGTR